MTSTEKSTNSVLRRDAARELLHAYRGHFDESTDADARKRNYQALVNSFYDLVTDFYRFGWGNSFHFAPRRNGEKFRDSLARCERFFADALDLSAGMKVLDVGCGVGGPMREIARHSGAHVVGLNNHAYQLEKADEESHIKGQDSLCTLLHGDFMSIPVADGSFDAAYSIEATPHAPDKQGVFDEVFRILKPGGEFAGFEWCLTDGFDPENREHRRLKSGIEIGNGLPELATTGDVVDALLQAGFELAEARDAAADSDPETPWYRALQGRDFSVASLPRTPLGRILTYGVTRILERIWLAPPGATEISALLNQSADDLVAAGIAGIFTPIFYFRARKRHT